MSNDNFEARSCTVSSKITPSLENKLSGIFLRSGQTLNISEQINRALELWTADNNTNFGTILAENQKKSLEIDAKTIYESANSLISGDNLMEICLKLAVIIRTHPKIFNNQSHLKDLATIIHESKVISDTYQDIIKNEVLLLLTAPQKKLLKEYLKKSTGKPSILYNKEGKLTYTGGTLDNDNNSSEILDIAQSCMTVPRRHREAKVQDCIYLIQSKYPPDKVGDYEATFLNAIERFEAEEEMDRDDERTD